ncbi:MAG TPA: flagellar basal body-associated FliL family protein [Polyangia bacterium]|jgi:Flagellar basal body-associated protein|nr:flagellar basal body-associated FliL family protein [Polyangia bacterium]
MAQNEDAAPVAAAAPKASANKLVPVILGVNVLMMGAVLFMVMRKPAAAAAPAPVSVEAPAPSGHGEAAGAGAGAGPGHAPAPGPVLKLENFVIQLRGVDQDRYVRVAFDVEVTADADKEVVQARLPQIRDSVISYFSDRTLDELRGSEGIERTKVALMKRLDEIVPGRRVHALYVTDFIIQ